MPTGRPLKTLQLTDAERAELERLVRRRKSSQALAERAKIILACADGYRNDVVAEKLDLHPATVCKWRQRFCEHRIQGLGDAPRSGPPRKIDDERVEKMIEKTLSSRPKYATHWSSREMAKETGMSQATVSRIWRTFGIQPHRTETFKLSTDPFFIEKVRDVVGLYMSPPENAVVLCVDEKSQIQAIDRTQPIFPLRPGVPQRHSHDYVRHGVSSLFAAWNVATGKVIGACHRRHRHQEFLKFLRKINTEVPKDYEVHLVLDNYGTHKAPAVKKWLIAHPRFVVHFIPTSSSWLNQVERFFAEITRRHIRRSSFTSVASLEKSLLAYLEHHNADPKPFVWTASADSIFGKLLKDNSANL